jgi:two-component system, OmpR family, response regulator
MRTEQTLLRRFTRPARGATVVILDEDEDARVILSAWLGTAGFEVVAAASAREAVTALDGRRAAVVVSELRGRPARAPSLVDPVGAEPALREAPLVVNTSRVTDADRAEARARGSVAFFVKPTDLQSLLACVRSLVDVPGDARGCPAPGGCVREGSMGTLIV